MGKCWTWCPEEWKINIFNIIASCLSFYSRITHILPPKPKSSFRHLKRGIQDFHINCVLVPADKAANNVGHICFSVLCLLCLCAHLFIYALWSPARKRLTSWLSFVVFNCQFVTFPLISWVRCGTWLYRSLIFAPYLTLSKHYERIFSLIETALQG